MVNWKPYLESICRNYAQWWQDYTLTDVVEQQVSNSLLLNLQVIQISQAETKVLNVITGLQKYATEHVLLIGRPGSGKSTALLRLLLEAAQSLMDEKEGQIKETSKIPILVELRYYQTSILDLIQNFLSRHSLDVDSNTINTLLRQGEILLLIDGINELSTQKAKTELQIFRHNYRQTTPMIFTTRELGESADLGISKKLAMQPLTEAQMREFVRAYLPDNGERMLQNLGGRLREFGETPLLLIMLCSVFASNENQIPPNLGSVFRLFTEIYHNKIKHDIQISPESRRWSQRLLQHLAWVMIEGEVSDKPDEKTELFIAIPRWQVEKIFTEFLKENEVNCAADCAMSWLDDLLNHHLIQIGAENKIEFRHQLIQEYYAAEMLLQQLENLSDDELRWNYLRYLKWTEPIALMMGLLDNQSSALRVVKLALQVDEQLGARLAGSVKTAWQKQTIDLINKLPIPRLFKIRLFGLSKSDRAIYYLSEDLRGADNLLRQNAAKYLGEITSGETISVLQNYLKDSDDEVRKITVESFGKVASHTDIPLLIEALHDQYYKVRNIAAESLGRIGSDIAISALIQTIQSCEHDYTRKSAAYALIKIGTTDVVNAVIQELIESDSLLIHEMAIQMIDHIESEQDSDDDVSKNTAQTIDQLLESLSSDPDSYVRRNAAISLGEIGSDTAVPGLIETLTRALQDYDLEIASAVAKALTEIGSPIALSKLIETMNKYFRREMP